MRNILVLLLGVTLLVVQLRAGFAEGDAKKKTSRHPSYYLAARATEETEQDLRVRGLTNLPAGAVLFAAVFDYFGQSSTTFSDDIVALTVDRDGHFEGLLHPRKGKTFRKNLLCQLTFQPGSSRQPKAVLAALTDSLGTVAENPLIVNNSGGNYLSLTIAVE
jgi:hypothetical protein